MTSAERPESACANLPDGSVQIRALLPALQSAPADTEQFASLLQMPGFTLEHIVSNGATSPPGFWYDQPDPEWVMLVRGEAELLLDELGVLRSIALQAGDALIIPARMKHRVSRTSTDAVWLALHFKGQDESSA